MNLLSWHGTVLRIDSKSGAWVHAVLWPIDEALVDFDLPDTGISAPCLVQGVIVEPSKTPGLLHIVRDEHYGRAQSAAARIAFTRLRPLTEESFMPLAASLVQRLRRILGSVIRIAETGEVVQPRMEEGFRIRAGSGDYPLSSIEESGGDGIVLRDGAQMVTLVPGTPLEPPARFLLERRKSDPPIVEDAASFLQGSGKAIILVENEECAFPPLTVSDDDQIWMQRNPWWADGQHWGRVSPRCQMARQRDVFVMMSRNVEGTIFDEDGIYTDTGYFIHMPVKRREHFSRSVDSVFIDREMLDKAPLLPGPHVMFIGGNVSNYYHWLIEALVPLHAMAPHLPHGTRLLLPASFDTIRNGPYGDLIPDHQKMLDDWGFGDLPRTVVTDAVCRVEEVYWMSNVTVESIPAVCLRAASAHALSFLPEHGETPRRRIYIRRPVTRRVHNDTETEAALAELGFTVHEMRDLTPRAQMALFASAEFVIGPHGADLSNLLFCAPGTKVIELSPDVQFRPFFAQISDKMGLVHGVLPCPTLRPDFQGNMQVDLGRLRVLIDQLRAWS